jgi:acid phosphatase type 7
MSTMARLAAAALIALASAASACGASDTTAQKAPRPPQRAGALLWAVGDGADGGSEAKRLAARVARDRPNRFLYLGDVYPAGSAADFRDRYATVYGRLAAITAPTPGNHDWPQRRDGYYPFWRAHLRSAVRPWYAFRAGGWLVLSLNSEAAHDQRSAQLRWLRKTLARHGGDCAIAFWHRPLRSAGLHGDQPDIAPLWAALRGHARIVLNGHDHDLQRFRAREGIVEYVAGAGGHGIYPVAASAPGLSFADDSHYGALRIALRPQSARLAFVSVGGSALDRSRVTCRSE